MPRWTYEDVEKRHRVLRVPKAKWERVSHGQQKTIAAPGAKGGTGGFLARLSRGNRSIQPLGRVRGRVEAVQKAHKEKLGVKGEAGGLIGRR